MGGVGAADDWQVDQVVGAVCEEDAEGGGGVCKVKKSELDQGSCCLAVGPVGRSAAVGDEGEDRVGVQLGVGRFGRAGDVVDGAAAGSLC